MAEDKKPKLKTKGRGRPATGKNQIVAFRPPRHILGMLNGYAYYKGMSRSMTLNVIIGEFLRSIPTDQRAPRYD